MSLRTNVHAQLPIHAGTMADFVADYHQHLPEAFRTATATVPRQPPALKDWGAWLVPQQMWDGVPNPDGLVSWKPQSDVGRRMILPCQDGLPPLYEAYVTTQRVASLPLYDRSTLWLLPPTLPQNSGFHYSLLTGAWVHLYRAARFLPLAESPDGALLACADRNGVRTGEDSPIYSFRSADLIRLEPDFFTLKAGADEVRPFGQLIHRSFDEMVATARSCKQEIPTDGVCTYRRPTLTIPPRFDWEPWLNPEPDPDQEAPDQSLESIKPQDLSPHLERIVAKLQLLGQLDPAYLVWGSECHRYRMAPPLHPDERTRFEQMESCHVPEAYAQFLMKVGNGGRGPWRWMRRLEYSGARWAHYWQMTNELDAGRLSKPFPYRRHWNPDISTKSKRARAAYDAARHIQGTIAIGEATDASMVKALVLVVASGPEKGHVWSDLRNFGEGIRPIVRRGPYSFIAWYEDSLDGELAKINQLYDLHRQRIARYLETGEAQP